MSHDKKDLVLKTALIKAARKLEGSFFGEIRYGWHNKSVGQAFRLEDNQLRWIKVASFNRYDLAEAYLNRVEQANCLKNIQKPCLYKGGIWQEEDTYIVSLLMSYISESPFSKESYLENEIELPLNWLQHLKKQLESLSIQPTAFISCRQDLITRRIEERYGNLDCQIQEWGTIHGDLN